MLLFKQIRHCTNTFWSITCYSWERKEKNTIHTFIFSPPFKPKKYALAMELNSNDNLRTTYLLNWANLKQVWNVWSLFLSQYECEPIQLHKQGVIRRIIIFIKCHAWTRQTEFYFWERHCIMPTQKHFILFSCFFLFFFFIFAMFYYM